MHPLNELNRGKKQPSKHSEWNVSIVTCMAICYFRLNVPQKLPQDTLANSCCWYLHSISPWSGYFLKAKYVLLDSAKDSYNSSQAIVEIIQKDEFDMSVNLHRPQQCSLNLWSDFRGYHIIVSDFSLGPSKGCWTLWTVGTQAMFKSNKCPSYQFNHVMVVLSSQQISKSFP